MKNILRHLVMRYDAFVSQDPITTKGNVRYINSEASSRNRIKFLILFFIFLYTIPLIRVYFLLISGSDTERPYSYQHSNREDRAQIVDRNGHLLASMKPNANLIAYPHKIDDPTGVALQIVHIYPELDFNKLEKALSNKKIKYYLVKRKVTPKEQNIIDRMGLAGVSYEYTRDRYYPQENSFFHVIGTLNLDKKPERGLEKYFNDYLIKNPKEKLTLSLDRRIQDVARNALKTSIDRHSALGGSAVVMDVYTGEIISMVSLPDFNPNDDSQRASAATSFNYAIQARELGSVFKIFNTAIALETNTSTLSTMYDVSKSYMGVSDDHPIAGSISVTDVLRKSSNIGSAKMINRLGPHVQEYFFRRLGFYNKSTIEIFEKSRTSEFRRNQDDMLRMSFGHAITITPIQLAQSVATVINGGYYVEPTLLKRDTEPQEIIKSKKLEDVADRQEISTPRLNEWASLWRQFPDKKKRGYYQATSNLSLENVKPKHGTRIFSKRTSDLVRYAMRTVCELGGTGKSSDVKGFPVIGKTGTADKYKGDGKVSSFVGAFPAQSPQYVVYVMVDEPKVNKEFSYYATGGVVAAPVVKEIIEHMAPIYKIKPLKYGVSPYSVSENMLEASYVNELKTIKLK